MHQSPKPTKSLAIHNTMNITLSHKLSTDSPILNNPLYNTPHRLPSLPITITITTTPSTALPFPLSLATPPHNKRGPRPSNQPNLIPRLRRRRPKSQITTPRVRNSVREKKYRLNRCSKNRSDLITTMPASSYPLSTSWISARERIMIMLLVSGARSLPSQRSSRGSYW